MAHFASVAEMAAVLSELDPDYAQHAAALWQADIRTPQHLAEFSELHYLNCDVPRVHIGDIKARADSAGESLTYQQFVLAS